MYDTQKVHVLHVGTCTCMTHRRYYCRYMYMYMYMYDTQKVVGTVQTSIMRLRFKRSATAFIASIDRGSASFEPRLRLV